MKEREARGLLNIYPRKGGGLEKLGVRASKKKKGLREKKGFLKRIGGVGELKNSLRKKRVQVKPRDVGGSLGKKRKITGSIYG